MDPVTQHDLTPEMIDPQDRPKPGIWARLVFEMGLTGLHAALASQSEAIEYDADRRVLRLEMNRQLEGFARQDVVESFCADVSTRLGGDFRIDVAFGEARECPAQMAKTRRLQQYEKAMEEIMNDQFVRFMIEEMDGKIIVDSVRPANPKPGR
jgi:hypothetical protein